MSEPAKSFSDLAYINKGQNLDPEKLKKRILFVTMAFSLLIAFSLTYYWFVYSLTHITTDNAYVETDIYPVNCRIMGYVKEVSAQENEDVKQGQVLAILDDTDFGVELSFKRAKFVKAKSDYERAEKLYKLKAISSADFELAQANFVACEADMNGTELKVKYARITSPADGVIAKKNIQVGQYVQPGQSLFIIVPNNNYWVKANYKETQLTHVKIGQRVEIRVDTYPKKIFHGHVESIFPTSGSKLSLLPPENATGNFTKVVQRIPIKISLNTPSSQKLRVGMSVVSTILIED